MKTHIGVDLHQRFCYLTAVDASGKELRKGQVVNQASALRTWLRQLPSPRQVVVEASGFWPAFARAVEPEAERIVMVHPQRVKAIASARLKNDRVDSETLAHLSRADLLPEAWMADERTQQARRLTRLRIALGRQRATAKNQLQAVLHQEGFLRPVADVFGKRGRAWLQGISLQCGRTHGGRDVAEGGRSSGWDDCRADARAGADGRGGCTSALVADGARDRGLFGDGDPGRGGPDRAVRQQAGAGQLCRSDPVGARVGGQA